MIDKNRDILVITSLLINCNSDFSLHFNEGEINTKFQSKLTYVDLNHTLDNFAQNDILTYSRGGEDGFAEEFEISLNKEKCFLFIQSLYIEYHFELQEKIRKQNEELKDIYGFLPAVVVEEINDSKAKLNEVLNSIKDSEYLKPLEPKIKEINTYLDKTEKVIKNYENIYLNVIKPLKIEGKQGIRATAIWAIVGIIVTTLISFYFSYKTMPQKPTLSKNLETKNISTEAVPSFDISKFESKVNFLVRENIGLNKEFINDKSIYEIKRFEEKVIFKSQTDNVMVEAYSFNDYKTGSSCYSSVDLRFYISNRLVTSSMLGEVFQLRTRITRNNFTYNNLNVIEGDTINFKSHTIIVEKIFSQESECNPVGDNFDGIRLRISN